MGESKLTNLTTKNFSLDDETTLYLENDSFDGHRASITASADALVLETEAFNEEPEVCGTQSMDILADYWHRIETTTIGYRTLMVEDVDKAMETVQLSIINTDQDIANALSVADKDKGEAVIPQETGIDGKSKAFDDDGSYGGDQGDAINNQSGIFLFGKWHIFYNKDLYDFVRQHPEYANLTDKEIRDLLAGMNEEGCGYVATANSIFCQYEGREEEFEKTFGFPMYDSKGELNYNKLIVDFYLETDDQFYLDGPYGKSSMINSTLSLYDDDPAAFKAKYGVDLFTDSTQEYYTSDAINAVTDEVNNISGDLGVVDGDHGTTATSRINRLDHYLAERGVTMTYDYSGGVDVEDIKTQLNDGKEVIIGAHDFYLNDENGKHQTSFIEGGHAMSVTGVTDDGKLIVSSWGDKYYIDPNESEIHSYSVIDIEE